MKVLFAAAEAAPFVRTGGLGDVAGALPKALQANGVECAVILPLYQEMKAEYRNSLHFVGSTTVSLAWRNQYAGVFKSAVDGVNYYFIDKRGQTEVKLAVCDCAGETGEVIVTGSSELDYSGAYWGQHVTTWHTHHGHAIHMLCTAVLSWF